MTLHKVGCQDAVGYADYLKSRDALSRRGDYYLGQDGQQIEGRGEWLGEGARELGLGGNVERADLICVWEGKDPRSGEIQVKRGPTGEHVAAIDATFSAPKSVSIAWALGDPELRDAIEAAQTGAVAVAVRHIEAAAPLTRRRTAEGVIHERAAGIVAARFRHHTSRLTEEQLQRGIAPDPQLHDHVAIANMAFRDPSVAGTSSRWAAIDSRELYRIAAEAGAVYRAELAVWLQRLGFTIERDGKFIEIAGVDPGLRRVFAARSVEVEAAKERFSLEHGRAPRVQELKQLVVQSRQPKSADAAPAFADWHARARDAGVDAALLLSTIRGRDVARMPGDEARRAVVRELTDPESAQYLTRTSAVIDDRALRIAIAEAAQARLPGRDIADLFATVQLDPELVRVDEVHWTTQRHLRMERQVLEAATAKPASSTRSPSVETVTRSISAARVPLTEEQCQAVRTLCRESSFHLLTAPAGSGKGEVLRVVAAAHRDAGYRVIATAAAGETAQRLGRELGTSTALTVDALILRARTGSLDLSRNDFVIVDEGALLETTRWHGLLEATRSARVIAAGDALQLSPIEAGGMWSALEFRLGAATLSENHRAREEWARDAWSALREGRSLDALRVLEAHGHIVISDTRALAREAAVAAWDLDRRAGATAGRDVDQYLLLTDASNREVNELNRAAQQRRLERGELVDAAVTVTAEERSGRLREETMYVNDRVTFIRQVRLEGERRIENGSSGRLIGVDLATRDARVRLADREVIVPNEELDAMRLGYAQHVYTAQGRTVERVYVVAGGWQTGREASYVGVSRARDASYVFADRSSLEVDGRDRHGALEELSRRMAASRENIAAVTRSGEVGRTEAVALSERGQRGDGRLTVEHQPRGAAEHHARWERQTDTDEEYETWRERWRWELERHRDARERQRADRGIER